MGQIIIKRYRPLLFSIVYAVILLVASFAKIRYPPEALKGFFWGVGLFEAALALVLLLYSTRPIMWVFIALIFAIWTGYSFFWLLWGLPCSCFGKMLELPPGGSFVADIVFYTGAIYILNFLKTSLKRIHTLLLISLLMAILGFLIAYGLNQIIAI
jgi:hypothetical protein